MPFYYIESIPLFKFDSFFLSVLPIGDHGELYFCDSLSYFNKVLIGDPIPLAPNALPELPLFRSPKSKEPFLSRLDIADASVFENY